MLKKLYILLIFSNLVVSKLLSYKVIVIHNFVTKFGKILEICANNIAFVQKSLIYNRLKPLFLIILW